MNLFAIDPGKHLIGFAHFRDATLVECTVIKFEHLCEIREHFMNRVISLHPALVSEVPQIYTGFQAKVPDDLIDVAMCAGACLSLVPNAWPVRPHEWKGSKEKALHQNQLLKVASPNEIELIEKVPKSVRHNAIDAYGIGKWYLGRFAAASRK